MLATVASIYTLLLGIGILLAGSGLLGTLLGLRAEMEAFSGSEIGVVMSAYFVGYVVGSYWCPPLIRRVGHIRAFAAMAALGATAVMIHPLAVNPAAWVILRVITGFCMLGLYMVIESWLNEQVEHHRRGKVFAVYMTTNLVALGIGQFLILPYGAGGTTTFMIAALLITLGLVPVALTDVREPTPVETPKLSVRYLFQISPLGVTGGFISGLGNGAFWGMGAVFGARIGLAPSHIAVFMSALILGGALLQFPIGHLSDRFDRRSVLTVVAFLSAALAALAWLFAGVSEAGLIVAAVLYGGFSFAVYSLSVAHLNDHIQPGEVLEATRGVLLLNGVGAALGPMLAGAAMELWGPRTLPLFWALSMGALGVFAVARMRISAPIPAEEQAEFVPLARTSPMALEMDPRAELEPEFELELEPEPEAPVN